MPVNLKKSVSALTTSKLANQSSAKVSTPRSKLFVYM